MTDDNDINNPAGNNQTGQAQPPAQQPTAPQAPQAPVAPTQQPTAPIQPQAPQQPQQSQFSPTPPPPVQQPIPTAPQAPVQPAAPVQQQPQFTPTPPPPVQPQMQTPIGGGLNDVVSSVPQAPAQPQQPIAPAQTQAPVQPAAPVQQQPQFTPTPPPPVQPQMQQHQPAAPQQPAPQYQQPAPQYQAQTEQPRVEPPPLPSEAKVVLDGGVPLPEGVDPSTLAKLPSSLSPAEIAAGEEGTKRKKRIGEKFMDMGLITPDQLNVALHQQKKTGKLLGETLVELGFLGHDMLTHFLSQMMGYEEFNPKTTVVDPEALKLIDKKDAAKYRVIPVSVSEQRGEFTIISVFAQRLVRRICPHCKTPYQASREECHLLGVNPEVPLTLYKGLGCKECAGIGNKGRIAIHEILYMDEEINSIIAANGDKAVLKKKAVDLGFKSMRDDGILKLYKGLIALPELRRVANFADMM